MTNSVVGLSSTEIKALLDRVLEPDKVNFLGVFAKNEIPGITDQLRFPAYLVANTANSTQAGEHWIALYFTDSLHCEFFDSFAFSPGFYGLSEYLNKFSITATVDFPLQSINSSVCGHYCIYYLFNRSLGHPMHLILRSFTTVDQDWNDNHVFDVVTNNFHRYSTHSHNSICTCPNLRCISRTALLLLCVLLRRSQ